MVDVSIVLGVHADHDLLRPTLDSILQQTCRASWECVIVANGGLNSQVSIPACIKSDLRFTLMECAQPGLTQALILGCEQARGRLIARIDVGDVMAPQRLQCQVEAFQRYPQLVLATSDVELCGPRWERLWINRGSGLHQGQPQRVDTCPPEQGITMDIPHHASVMFRRSAYNAVGGYRSEFYFGQDWDLWYRLASKGTFLHIPDVLTRVRLFPTGLSSRHWREQRAIAQLSLACHAARSRGASQRPLLRQAAAIRPRPPATRKPLFDGARAEGAYFIAEALRRNGDRRSWNYFHEGLRHGFWKPRIWLRAWQSLTLAIDGFASRP